MSYTIRPVKSSWADAVSELGRHPYAWFWADLDGLQWKSALPERAPIATHVWGWVAGQRWVRLRLDENAVIGAVLESGPDPLAVQQFSVLHWASGEGRVAPNWASGAPDAVTPLRLVHVGHPYQLTFMEASGT